MRDARKFLDRCNALTREKRLAMRWVLQSGAGSLLVVKRLGQRLGQWPEQELAQPLEHKLDQSLAGQLDNLLVQQSSAPQS